MKLKVSRYRYRVHLFFLFIRMPRRHKKWLKLSNTFGIRRIRARKTIRLHACRYWGDCVSVCECFCFICSESDEIEMLKNVKFSTHRCPRMRCQFKSLNLDREKYAKSRCNSGTMACKEHGAVMCSPAIVCVAIFVVFVLMIRLFRVCDMEREVAGLHIMRRYIFNGSQPYYSSQCININSISNVWPFRNIFSSSIRLFFVGRVCVC